VPADGGEAVICGTACVRSPRTPTGMDSHGHGLPRRWFRRLRLRALIANGPPGSEAPKRAAAAASAQTTGVRCLRALIDNGLPCSPSTKVSNRSGDRSSLETRFAKFARGTVRYHARTALARPVTPIGTKNLVSFHGLSRAILADRTRSSLARASSNEAREHSLTQPTSKTCV
jgi:hypothetical protein